MGLLVKDKSICIGSFLLVVSRVILWAIFELRFSNCRGQMGLSNEEQRLQQKGAEVHLDGINNGTSEKEQLQGGSDEVNRKDGANCCQGANGFSCCRDESVVENKGIAANGTFDSRNASTKDAHTQTSWFKKWEQSDIVTALAVIGAVASVTVAYSIYRRSA